MVYTAQLALFGMDAEQMQEASWAVNSVTGTSAYMYGIGYDLETFKQELDAIIEHVKKSAQG